MPSMHLTLMSTFSGITDKLEKGKIFCLVVPLAIASCTSGQAKGTTNVMSQGTTMFTTAETHLCFQVM